MTPIELMLVTIGFVAFAYEIASLVTPGWHTISHTLREDGCRWLIWPVLFGVLPFHFWTPALPWSPLSWGTPVTLAFAAVVLLRDFVVRTRVQMKTAFAFVVIGCAIGALIWNQG